MPQTAEPRATRESCREHCALWAPGATRRRPRVMGPIAIEGRTQQRAVQVRQPFPWTLCQGGSRPEEPIGLGSANRRPFLPRSPSKTAGKPATMKNDEASNSGRLWGSWRGQPGESGSANTLWSTILARGPLQASLPASRRHHAARHAGRAALQAPSRQPNRHKRAQLSGSTAAGGQRACWQCSGGRRRRRRQRPVLRCLLRTPPIALF